LRCVAKPSDGSSAGNVVASAGTAQVNARSAVLFQRLSFLYRLRNRTDISINLQSTKPRTPSGRIGMPLHGSARLLCPPHRGGGVPRPIAAQEAQIII
jgi:hypothetical protein